MHLAKHIVGFSSLLGLIATLVVMGATNAIAAPVACEAGGSTNFTVASEAELNDAISCYNDGTPGPGDYTITLTADIESGFLFGQSAFTTIGQDQAGYTLAIDGAGFALRAESVSKLIDIEANAGPITIDNLHAPSGNVFADAGFATALGIDASGPVTIRNSSLGADAQSILAADSGLVSIENSKLGAGHGVIVMNGSLTVRNSSIFPFSDTIPLTFTEFATGITHQGTGNLLVENTTTGAIERSQGASATDSSVVRNSTMTSLGTIDTQITVSSSIVLTDFCDGLIDGGGNVGCFPENLQPFATIVRDPVDNGCAVPTPTGCVLTASLPAGSPAFGIGDCTTATTDARGEPRTPAGIGCDAGAYESGELISPETCLGLAVTIDMNLNGGNGVGTPGDDVILGTPAADLIYAGDGDDTVCAGDGDDSVHAGIGDDRVAGGEGNDRLFGSKGADTLEGEDGDDRIHGNRGADHLAGGPGNDFIFGYSENDFILGGDGNDRLHGNRGFDIMYGGEGDDVMYGYAHDDRIFGQGGNDLIDGNYGNDKIDGGDGNDVLGGGGDMDNVIGGPGDDTLDGKHGNDLLDGNEGNDRLNGGTGNDVLNGDQGGDRLNGGWGDDILNGGDGGNDRCFGNQGTDTASGCEALDSVP